MSLEIAVITALLTFVLTGVFANYLIQKWQYRNWINQQRFLGSEKKYEALKSHADDIAQTAAKRLSAMFRLLLSLDQSNSKVEDRLKIYNEAIDIWNQKINSFSYKTTMYFNWEMSRRLEEEIHDAFVTSGGQIERLVRLRMKEDESYKKDKSKILDSLNGIQGRLIHYNRDMLRHVLRQHASTYHGVKIRYKMSDLYYFSTWQLFKALFISRIDDFSITLTAFELEDPAVSGD